MFVKKKSEPAQKSEKFNFWMVKAGGINRREAQSASLQRFLDYIRRGGIEFAVCAKSSEPH